MEQWMAIPGFNGKYQVSNMGNVRSCHRCKRGQWKLLRPNTSRDKSGRRNVTLTVGKKSYQERVYRLVMLAFVGKCPYNMEVAHNNGVCTDDRLENLRYCTSKENNSDKIKHGTLLRGESNGNSRLTEKKAKQIIQMISQGISQRQISEIMEISRGAISGIASNANWRHLPRQPKAKISRRKTLCNCGQPVVKYAKCAECQRTYSREYRKKRIAEAPEIYRAHTKKYYWANREKKLAYYREYYRKKKYGIGVTT